MLPAIDSSNFKPLVGFAVGFQPSVKVYIRSELVRPLGFEPRTCGLRVRCSAIELEALGLKDHTM